MRWMLTGMSAILICGCLSRGGNDLLQARLRDQQERLIETERQIAAAQTELRRSRQEADNLRAELARVGSGLLTAEQSESLVRVSKLQINSLLTGGVNKDEQPGDDAFVAQVAPVDDDGEVVKLPGSIELTLIDPALPEDQRDLGQWTFTAEECRARWTRGFTGAGFQFTLPLDDQPLHDSLVLHARLVTADGRSFDANQIVRVTPPTAMTASARRTVRDQTPLELDDINDPPPAPLNESSDELPNWADPADAPQHPAGRMPLRDSTNWTGETIPQLR